MQSTRYLSILRNVDFVARTFGLTGVRPLLCSAYRLGEKIAPGSLDIVLLAGVLYHLSDMLVGPYATREVLKPEGVLLVQSSGVDDFEHFYANCGRFVAGRWWQPTGLCLQDMFEFMGYTEGLCASTIRPTALHEPSGRRCRYPLRRDLIWPFENLRDGQPRTLDASLMAPAPRKFLCKSGSRVKAPCTRLQTFSSVRLTFYKRHLAFLW
jgi:hypothetical protein